MLKVFIENQTYMIDVGEKSVFNRELQKRGIKTQFVPHKR